MRIGITCYPTFGGSGVVATELGQYLSKKHEIHFICYDVPFRLRKKVKFHKVDVLPYPLFKYPPYTLALATKMVEVVERENLDILHVHYAIPHSTSAYLAKQLVDVKFVTTLHGTDTLLVGLDPSYKKITKFSIEVSDGVTVVSQYLKWRTIKDFDIKNDVRVIYNFVDPKKFLPKKKENLMVHISNFRPVKKVQDILKAYSLISEKIDCKLLMVGRGPERKKAMALSKKLNLKNVTFMGNIPDVEKILGKASLFMLSSEIESFGLTALEAMSCETPVVATKVGGLPEVVGKDCGILVEFGNHEALAKASIRILEDDSLRKEMGRRGRKKVFEKFTPEKIVPIYESYYQEILG